MANVLLIGFDPDAVDYSDPALPQGMTAEKIRAGIETGLRLIRERGWEAASLLIRPDDAPEAVDATIRRDLSSAARDCVVIGAGVRLPPKHLKLLEVVVNAVHRAAPTTAIAFNTHPEDSADAAARWVAG